LLSPSIDHLFDREFISFGDDGMLLISPVADGESLNLMGVPTDQPINIGSFERAQQAYLAFHRREIFKQAEVVD
jgi:putative restriction endonuclease